MRPSATVRRTAALILVLLAAVAATGCGDEPSAPKAKTGSVASPAPDGDLTTFTADPWGFSLVYDSTVFRLESAESRSDLPLTPSLLTGREVRLRGLKTLDVSLVAADVTQRSAAPGVGVTVQEMASSVGSDGLGLARHVLSTHLDELERVWEGVLWDEPQTSALGGNVDAVAIDAVGYDPVAAADLHVRTTVAVAGRFVYTVREYAPRDQWDAMEPRLRRIVDSVRLKSVGNADGPQPAAVQYRNERYGFSLELPAGFPLVSEQEDPTPELRFGTQFCDVARSPFVAVAVGVAEAPEGIGNSQSRLLKIFYRSAVDRLAREPGVEDVRPPRAVQVNGSTAWVIDVTRRQAGHRELRTVTYDIWRDARVYSLIIRGRVDHWQSDRPVLQRIVQSFRVD